MEPNREAAAEEIEPRLLGFNPSDSGNDMDKKRFLIVYDESPASVTVFSVDASPDDEARLVRLHGKYWGSEIDGAFVEDAEWLYAIKESADCQKIWSSADGDSEGLPVFPIEGYSGMIVTGQLL